MLFKSIRFKIILWYMLVLTLTLSLFSVAVYKHFGARVYGDLDELLVSRAEGVGDAIDLFWQRGQARDGKGIAVTVPGEIDRLEFVKVAQQWINQESGQPRLLNFIVRIYDVNGLNIVSSPDASFAAALSPELRTAAAAGRNLLQDITLEASDGEVMMLRSCVHAVIKNGRPAYIVQVATPLTAIHSALFDLRLVLFVLLPLTIALTGIAGAFLARKALHPVNGMIATIRQITAQNMKLRVAVPDTRDELKSLADTFNDMLVRLDKALTAQQQLVQDISHEFKTPLTVLKGQLEVTLKRLRAPAEYEQVLSSSLEEIDKLTRIVEDMLTLARFDNKEARLSTAEFDLVPLARKTLDVFGPLAGEKNVCLAFEAPASLRLNADHALIRRVLLNLLSNALKFTPPGGSVRLELDSDGSHARLTVADTGIGIAPGELPRIFDRFYCADKSHSSHGLGLSIVKSIVDAHRGRIEVSSTVSRGSTFSVILPALTPAAPG